MPVVVGGLYQDLAHMSVPVAIFEAPHRLRESLDDAIDELGEQRMALVAREMTKQFEELRRGTLQDLRAHYDGVEPLGEFTIVLGPGEESDVAEGVGNAGRVAQLLAEQDLPTRAAADILAAATGVSRREAYAMILAGRSRE